MVMELEKITLEQANAEWWKMIAGKQVYVILKDRAYKMFGFMHDNKIVAFHVEGFGNCMVPVEYVEFFINLEK